MKIIRQSHNQPWFNDTIKSEIVLRRKKEHTYFTDPTHYNFQAFYNQRRYVANLIKTAQRNYYITRLKENRMDYKKIYQIANKLLFRSEPSPLPDYEDITNLATEFNDYFISKITTIMDNLRPQDPIDTDQSLLEDHYLTDKRFGDFEVLDEEKVLQLIKDTPTKTCALDPLPTALVKNQSEVLSPYLTKIINTSFQDAEFPDNLKKSNVCPLIKSIKLQTILKSYRPVSNLTYISKLIERAACPQIMEFATISGNMEPYQSAYRPQHSTETALLRVKMDILKAMDNKEICCLLLLISVRPLIRSLMNYC